MQFSPFMNVEPSATLAMNALANAKKTKGERVYNLSAGEPMVAPHPRILEAAENAMREGKTLYPPVAGILELRQAAVEWMNKNYDSHYTENETIVTCGGKFGIFALCQALIQPGDEAVVLAPYWVSYPAMVRLFGGEAVAVETREEDGWKVDAGELEQVLKIKNKIKILFLNNGGNPTGVLYSRSEMKAVLGVAAKYGVTVISDEVYSGLTYEGEYVSAASFPEYRENVVVIQSMSKHFAMTGWRVGLVFGPESVIKVLSMLQSQSTTGTSSVSQWAALGAIQYASEIVPSVKGKMQKRRDVFVKTFAELFSSINNPTAGLYAFVSMKALDTAQNDSNAFCIELLEKGNVALVPGAAFGKEGYVRFSFGAEEKELVEALRVLKDYLSEK